MLKNILFISTNKVRGSFFSISLLFLTFAFIAEGHEKKWPEKRLRQVWPEAQSFTSKQISLSPAQITQLNSEGIKIGSEDRSPTFYLAQKNLGIILFVDEYGANGLMEVSVAMGADGKIHKIDLWEHTENPLVAKDEFLKQFIGKGAKDSFVEKKDFNTVPEAIKASVAVSKAAEKALKITSIIFEKK